jgi:TRAP-type C4-dicarboxylate transport system permease small subunit
VSGNATGGAFDRSFNHLLTFLIRVVALSIGLMAVLIPLNLLLVKMTWGSIWWLHEAVEYALYVGVFIGAPWVLRQGAHVRVDVVTSALPNHISIRLEQAVDAGGAILCAALAFYGARMAMSEYEDGTMPDKDLRIPSWIMMMVFSVSFVLLTIEFAFRTTRPGEIVSSERSEQADTGL